jgi:hypothetical protein
METGIDNANWLLCYRVWLQYQMWLPRREDNIKINLKDTGFDNIKVNGKGKVVSLLK